MGYKLNIRGASDWDNILKDSNIEITDSNGYFTSDSLEGVLDELFNNSGGSLSWSKIFTNTTASKDTGYFVDTSLGTITLTLPSSATIGDTLVVSDYSGNFSTNKCTIARNGHKIMGLAEDFDLDVDNLAVRFVYVDSTQGWRIITTTTSGSGSGIIWSTTTANVTASSGEGYFVDTTSGGLTVTLPSSPTLGDQVAISDLSETFDTNNCTVGRNGSNIMGLAENMTLDVKNLGILFVYSNSTEGWKVVYLANGAGGSTTNPPVSGVNPPVSGAYVTGNIFGGELVYNTSSTVDISAFSCMSDDLTTALSKASTTTVSITGASNNTAYNIFAVDDGGTVGCDYDTDIDGANLPGTVTAKRWLGFVLTDGSGDIHDFNHKDDIIWFREFVPIVTGNNLFNTPAQINYTGAKSGFPTTRVKESMFSTNSNNSTGFIILWSIHGTTAHTKLLSQVVNRTGADDTDAGPSFVPVDAYLYCKDTSRDSGTVELVAVRMRR